jgi:hypothetical protein
VIAAAPATSAREAVRAWLQPAGITEGPISDPVARGARLTGKNLCVKRVRPRNPAPLSLGKLPRVLLILRRRRKGEDGSSYSQARRHILLDRRITVAALWSSKSDFDVSGWRLVEAIADECVAIAARLRGQTTASARPWSRRVRSLNSEENLIRWRPTIESRTFRCRYRGNYR